MPGASKLNIESVLRNAQKTARGLWKCLPIPLAGWTLGSGVVLAATGSGIVGGATAATSLTSISWNATADNGDTIQTGLVLPADFRAQIGAATPKLVLYVRARVVDAASGANADLELRAQCFWHKTADTALSTLGTAVGNVVGATDYAEAAEEGFILYKFDLTAAMSAAQLALLAPLDTFHIQLYPHEAVGTSLTLQVVGTFLMYEGHASVPASVLSTLSLT